MTSPGTAYRSAEDIWQHRNYDSAESLSSVSSGHSGGGTPSLAQTSHDVVHSLMRSSQSYPYIPPPSTGPSGRVHDPTSRSSLPIPSLDVVPPRGVNTPATAGVMQHGPFTFRPDDAQFNHHDPTLPHSAGVLVTEPFGRRPRGALDQHGRAEPGQNLSLYNMPGASPTAVRAGQVARPKTVTSGVTYRVNPPSASAGEQSKPTYLTATHVNLLTPDDGGGGGAERLQSNRLSDSVLPGTSSDRLSGGAYSAVYINPQQSWLCGPRTPTTYVSALSSSCDCLLPSVTDVSRPSPSSTHIPASGAASSSASVLASANSSSHLPSSESATTDPNYANGTKYAATIHHHHHYSCLLYTSPSPRD